MLLRHIWNEMVDENQLLSITGQLSNAEATENRALQRYECMLYVRALINWPFTVTLKQSLISNF